jgi:hypothetical protein
MQPRGLTLLSNGSHQTGGHPPLGSAINSDTSGRHFDSIKGLHGLTVIFGPQKLILSSCSFTGAHISIVNKGVISFD